MVPYHHHAHHQHKKNSMISPPIFLVHHANATYPNSIMDCDRSRNDTLIFDLEPEWLNVVSDEFISYEVPTLNTFNTKFLIQNTNSTTSIIGRKIGVCIGNLKYPTGFLVLEYDLRLYAIRMALVAALIAFCFMVWHCTRVDNLRPPTVAQSGNCVICWSSSRQLAFNCGHVATCQYCGVKVRLCPVCRTPIRRRLRVYFP